MVSAWRSAFRLPPIKDLPFHWPGFRVWGARPARLAALARVRVPNSRQQGQDQGRRARPEAGDPPQDVALALKGLITGDLACDPGIDLVRRGARRRRVRSLTSAVWAARRSPRPRRFCETGPSGSSFSATPVRASMRASTASVWPASRSPQRSSARRSRVDLRPAEPCPRAPPRKPDDGGRSAHERPARPAFGPAIRSGRDSPWPSSRTAARPGPRAGRRRDGLWKCRRRW